jgi:chaperonin GroES
MTIRPLHDRIFAKRITPEAKTTGGLHIPDNAKEKPMEAIVIAVGSGKITEKGTLVPPTVKAGDRILIGKYTGSEVTVEGEDHIIVGEDDVLAVLEGAR